MKSLNPSILQVATSAPTVPSGFRGLYPKSDGWYDRDSAGTETKLASGGASPVFQARAATTGNHGLSGLAAVDGITPSAGDIVLVRANTAMATNGAYVAASGAWSRHSSFDTAAELAATTIAVQSGTLYGGTLWRTTLPSTAALGTDDMPWVRVNSQLDLRNCPLYIYGHSYATIPGLACTAGLEWPTQLRARTGAPSVTSYAISGGRIADMATNVISQFGNTGIAGPVSGALWPGTSSRPGVVFLDMMFNDVGHYSTFGGAPVAITSTDTRYVDGLAAMYRTFLAVVSSESRVEQSAATFTGTWASTAVGGGYSGDSVAYTTTLGAAASYSVTPAQEGPLAGRVYLLVYTLDAGSFTMAPITISVDGAPAIQHAPAAWEPYVYWASGNVQVIPYVIPVDLPIDGAAHTILQTHNGVTGTYMYSDAVIVPSDNPNPVAVFDDSWVKTGTWTAPQVAIWRANVDKVFPVLRDVVDEFPNTVWVNSNITANGLATADGIHPNDRGMQQRVEDALAALVEIQDWVNARQMSVLADAKFAVT